MENKLKLASDQAATASVVRIKRRRGRLSVECRRRPKALGESTMFFGMQWKLLFSGWKPVSPEPAADGDGGESESQDAAAALGGCCGRATTERLSAATPAAPAATEGELAFTSDCALLTQWQRRYGGGGRLRPTRVGGATLPRST